MCEALVMAADQTHPDPYMDVGRYKRGDVVVVCEDGWKWGREELKAPFRVLKLPGVSVSEMQAFLAREPEDDPAQPSLMRQRRAFHINLDHAKAKNGASFADLMAARVKKPKRNDPNVL